MPERPETTVPRCTRIPIDLDNAIVTYAQANGLTYSDVFRQALFMFMGAPADNWSAMRDQAYTLTRQLMAGMMSELPETYDEAIARGFFADPYKP